MATLTTAPPDSRTVSRGTRPSRTVPPREPAAPTTRGSPETSLDEIVERWWTALAASESAVRAAQRAPGGRGLLAGIQPRVSERADVIRLLKQLEHELQEHSRLLPWLSRASITNRMLGLPRDDPRLHLRPRRRPGDELRGARGCVGEDLRPVPAGAGRPPPATVCPVRPAARVRRPGRRPTAPPGCPVVPRQPWASASRREARTTRLEALTVHALANRKNQLLQQHLRRDGVAAFSGSRAYLEAVRMAGIARAVVSPSANTDADPSTRRPDVADRRAGGRLDDGGGAAPLEAGAGHARRRRVACSGSSRARPPPSRRRRPGSPLPVPPASGSSSPSTATATARCYGRARRTSSSATRATCSASAAADLPIVASSTSGASTSASVGLPTSSSS